MSYHVIAFFLGYLLDLVFGDPYWFPHPIRLIGRLITGTEKILLNNADKKTKKLCMGILLVVFVIACTISLTTAIIIVSYSLHPYIGLTVEGIMTYQVLAAKCLKVESMKVYKCLRDGDLEKARKAVSMIVGRDTNELDEEGVTKAAIETVAENTSDGVVAPMIYLAIGGPILGFFYKAVNTMDSMVGYKNDKYIYFGWAAAKLDDIVNYIPSRVCAFLMIAVSFLSGSSYSGKNALMIYKRDRMKHASPNSAQTESACAGALGIRLSGDVSYFGKIIKKPFIGEPLRSVEYEDIKRANYLMYATAWLCEILCMLFMFAFL